MELWDDGENRESSEGRQMKGSRGWWMESMGVRQTGLRRWRMESKAVRQEGSRQSRRAWMGDGGGSEEANGVGMCSPIKGIIQLLENNPSHVSIPP